jgi:rSAM/selenodomain-associated transferase 2
MAPVQRQGDEKISIVMPVLNEAGTLRRTLSALTLSESEELIVVDGGSTDGAAEIAREFTPKTLAGPKGRARQMNLGAENAEGPILLFLHADCRPPRGAFDLIRGAMEDKAVSAGAFDLAIDHPSFRFRIIEVGANLRSRVTGVPYGDQGLFMRKSMFEHIGGFEDIPLMEDVEIAGRLRKEGKVVFLRPPMVTAPRRWLREGPVFTTLRDWGIALAYSMFRVCPEKLAKYYRDVR